MSHERNWFKSFFQDRLTLRIGLLVALTEAIVLATMAAAYMGRFNDQHVIGDPSTGYEV